MNICLTKLIIPKPCFKPEKFAGTVIKKKEKKKENSQHYITSSANINLRVRNACDANQGL